MDKKKHDQDTQAILARREAFVKSVLSKSEIDSAKGGINICLTILPCLIIDPCLSILPA
jgi:hypothetical protein